MIFSDRQNFIDIDPELEDFVLSFNFDRLLTSSFQQRERQVYCWMRWYPLLLRGTGTAVSRLAYCLHWWRKHDEHSTRYLPVPYTNKTALWRRSCQCHCFCPRPKESSKYLEIATYRTTAFRPSSSLRDSRHNDNRPRSPRSTGPHDIEDTFRGQVQAIVSQHDEYGGPEHSSECRHLYRGLTNHVQQRPRKPRSRQKWWFSRHKHGNCYLRAD